MDIPKQQLAELSHLAHDRRIPRVEVIRHAVTQYLAEHGKPVSAFIGLWAKQGATEDGMAYQDRMRAEW